MGIAVILGVVLGGTSAAAASQVSRAVESVHPIDLVALVGVGLALASPVVLAWLWRADYIRPGSPGRRGVRDVSAWPWWFYLVCALSVLFAQQAGSGIGALAASGGSDMAVRAAAAVSGGICAAAAGLMLLVMVAGRGTGAEDGMRARVSGRAVGLGLGAIALAYPVVQGVAWVATQVSVVVRGRPPDEITHETLRVLREEGTVAAWVMAGGAVVLAPIVEELVFRAFLQSALLRALGGRGGGVWMAVILSSLLFAGVHLGGGVKVENAHMLAPLFVLGVAMGLAYERTKNIVVPIVMHTVFNGVNVAMTVAM